MSFECPAFQCSYGKQFRVFDLGNYYKHVRKCSMLQNQTSPIYWTSVSPCPAERRDTSFTLDNVKLQVFLFYLFIYLFILLNHSNKLISILPDHSPTQKKMKMKNVQQLKYLKDFKIFCKKPKKLF